MLDDEGAVVGPVVEYTDDSDVVSEVDDETGAVEDSVVRDSDELDETGAVVDSVVSLKLGVVTG